MITYEVQDINCTKDNMLIKRFMHSCLRLTACIEILGIKTSLQSSIWMLYFCKGSICCALWLHFSGEELFMQCFFYSEGSLVKKQSLLSQWFRAVEIVLHWVLVPNAVAKIVSKQMYLKSQFRRETKRKPLISLKQGSCFYLLGASFLDRGMMPSVRKAIDKSLKY